MTTHRPTSALPLSPLTKAEIRIRHADATLIVAFRAGETVARLDSSQRPVTSYDTSWILDAARDWNLLDAALTVRYSDLSVSS
jgi:hypothetical protein